MAANRPEPQTLDAAELMALSDGLWECMNSGILGLGGKLPLSPTAEDRIPINPYLVASCLRILPLVLLGARVVTGKGRHAKLATLMGDRVKDLDRTSAYWTARRDGFTSTRSLVIASRSVAGTPAGGSPTVIRQALTRERARLRKQRRSITPTEGVIQQLVRQQRRK